MVATEEMEPPPLPSLSPACHVQVGAQMKYREGADQQLSTASSTSEEEEIPNYIQLNGGEFVNSTFNCFHCQSVASLKSDATAACLPGQ